jgi:hypothetical protein
MYSFQWLTALGAAVWSFHVYAQSDGADSKAIEAERRALPYRSAFADYRRFEEERWADWRQLNNAVRDAAATPTEKLAPQRPDQTPAEPADRGLMHGHGGKP